MTDERWSRVKALFQAAVERPAGERAAFLAAATGDDDALRRDVESLLASDASGVGFLDELPVATEQVLAEALSAEHALLPAGHRLNAYEVIAPLGAGAMGEVYRARDSKLNRDVALKVLPERFALDPDRAARFTREAQLLATLSHPNIGAIYGLEESTPSTGSGQAVRALVLELVEGPTLADRIARGPGRRSSTREGGPLPLGEALPIARQIADALAAAHEKGIIHRDLKPANIKIAPDGVVKVLDFGLAKVWDGASQADLAGSPRLTATEIGERAILGTPTYMSPEQARGQSLDRRTDIWSFGCVVYEMLTGHAPFAGDTISDTLAAILEREPDWAALPATTPAPIARLLRRCLEKDRRKRLDSVADARLEIEDAIAIPAAEALAPAQTTSRRVTPAAIAAMTGLVVIAVLVTWILMRPAPAVPVLPTEFTIVPTPAEPLNVSTYDRDLAISHDGRHFVYRAGLAPPTIAATVMVRAADDGVARQLPGVSALGVFFSPESRWIGFFTRAELKKVPIAGGPPTPIARVTGTSLGASWGDDNMIVFATTDPQTGLLRVSADGGEPEVLTRPDPAQRGSDHAFPSVLPGGRAVLFTVTAAGKVDNAEVAVLDLKTRQRKPLIRGGSQAEFVDPSGGADPIGYLIYAAAGTLRAVRFDPARLEVLSDPVTVVEQVMIKPTGAANYALSRQGTLFYVPDRGVPVQMSLRSLVWVDRSGREEPTNAPLKPYGYLRLSPDETRVVLGVTDRESNDIWIWDLGRETMRRLTFAPGSDSLAFWTPDSQRIIFTSDRDGILNLYSQAADGTGEAERLTTSANQQFPTSISADKRSVVGFEEESDFAGKVWLYPLPGFANPSQAAQTLFDGAWAEFSPNGRYLAYQSAGPPSEVEIYVRPFPDVDSRLWQISTAGGTRPAWARNGRELFYLDASNTLTAVQVQTSGLFDMGKPAKVFDIKYSTPYPPRPYDVSGDGRFLMLKDSAPGDQNVTPATMLVVQHWFEKLKRLVGTR